MYLTSTLNYLKRTNRLFSILKFNTPPNSVIGKLYEEKCQKVVNEAFETPVALVGGANDGGVDLRWNKIVGSDKTVNFIGQCKYRDGKRIQPDVVRALEGSVSAHPLKTVGVLLTNRRPSIESLKTLNESVYPMMYLNIKESQCCKYVYEVLMNNKLKTTFPEIKILECRTPDSGVFFKLKFK